MSSVWARPPLRVRTIASSAERQAIEIAPHLSRSCGRSWALNHVEPPEE